ncbi:MAG: hypothetical protein WAK44_22740 [Trebonia sp.]|uniref:hypothetical protein n=1 Tax=Trebonia sp. TaxID=2767075 RepID=UPI003BAF0E08
MISTQETRATVRPDFDGPYLEGMAWDLATVSGALSEIATTWRRALPCRPDLPLDLPQRLADMARRLAADIRSLAAARALGEERADLGLEVTIRMSALSQGADYARAITLTAGAASVGDAPLWELLRPALRRTGRTFTSSQAAG